MKLCEACHVFQSDGVFPVGEGAAELCYKCAHAVCKHETTLEDAKRARCKCDRTEVYPAAVLATRTETMLKPRTFARRFMMPIALS